MASAEVVASIQEALSEEWGRLVVDGDKATSWRSDDLAWFAWVTSGTRAVRGKVGIYVGVYVPEQAAAILDVPPCLPGAAVPNVMYCTLSSPILLDGREDDDARWFAPGGARSEERSRLLEVARDGARYLMEHYGTRRAIVHAWESSGELPDNPPSRAAATAAILYAHLLEDDAATRALNKARRLASEAGSEVEMQVVELVAKAIAEGRI